jgi:hypothetical protein
VLPTDKLTPVLNTNVANDQYKYHKVLLLSDNQGGGCAERIKNRLPYNFEVWRLVKPGASLDILNKPVLTETSKFTRKDFIVLWQGSRDVSSNRTTFRVKNILQFVMNNLHSNIIVINVPYRHDLPMWSCLNKEILSFSKKLEKCLKSFNSVSLIKTN